MAPFLWLGLLVALHLHAQAAARRLFPPPTVHLDNQNFTGVVQSFRTQSFLGIPFALPPVGDLRFRLPVPVPQYSRPHTVATRALACPQQRTNFPVSLKASLQNDTAKLISQMYQEIPSQEDCLTLDVIKPAKANATSNPLPVWIFGGGFQAGSSTPSPIGGTDVVERSITVGQEVIYVAMNHRVSAFGFLASKEVRDAGLGNLGLHDQREALRWVQRYIHEFGGDPNHVTLWGESSGAISISLHMLAFGGTTDGLFHAAFMQSGAPTPVGPIENGQKYYDDIVRKTGCSVGHSDTLDCLRTTNYTVLKKAQDESPSVFSPQSLALAWMPREDGVFLLDHPQRLVQQGRIAHIPIVSGKYSLILTTWKVSEYIKDIYIPEATPEDLRKINTYYPEADTFPCFNLPFSRQFKRLAGFQGDSVFQAPRRFFQQRLPSTQKQWSFLHKRAEFVPCFGAFHASDVLKIIISNLDLLDYVINFARNFDPNVGTEVDYWLQYSTAEPLMMTFEPLGRSITNDTYRPEAMSFLTELSLKYPL
ncbi:carotenoid ester lipase precursor [Mycena crocata]|nr:carotenoid ester lipase precursor [Mycena crocata]